MFGTGNCSVKKKHHLFGGLEHESFDFPYIGSVIIPTDELIFLYIFQRDKYTTNQ